MKLCPVQSLVLPKAFLPKTIEVMETRVPPPPPPPPPPSPPPPSPPPPATTILGKYRMIRYLGQGSFAKVIEAKPLSNDGSSSPNVAIKIFKRKNLDPEMEPRIIDEVEAMRRLHHHPNIIKIHEVMATKTYIYLVMELADDGELFNKICGGRKLKVTKVWHYFQQLVSALRFCHQNGVAHRDVKPQNLFLDKAGNLKVSDFGLSALPDRIRNGLLHTACGTPAYTAPEVLTRRGYDGARADAWSCGIILYHLLTEKLPFDDQNIAANLMKIKKRDYQFPASITGNTQKVITRLLDPNPKTRLALDELVQLPWFKKLIPTPSQEPSLFESTARYCKPTETEISSATNAFDIIASLSSGLNLSGLFESSKEEVINKREKRFTAVAEAESMVEKVKEIGDGLGFRSERGKGGWSLGFGKGRVVLIIEIMKLTPTLLIGEVKVVKGGFELEELQWQKFKSGLQDVGLSWLNDTV
ncbi:CBL-interacting serine/threonine-protein kinase 7-like [Humulus lupulus]|uniref:CBL-interacting serine/threonine-protein kinase 7-like n=1 Tax=Humulus lupulus TaxID=3486 RepID=UPI002B41463A|nr:CBL-interacting serine/threonine-protein kinase 7-like [Humulus lupulus]